MAELQEYLQTNPETVFTLKQLLDAYPNLKSSSVEQNKEKTELGDIPFVNRFDINLFRHSLSNVNPLDPKFKRTSILLDDYERAVLELNTALKSPEDGGKSVVEMANARIKTVTNSLKQDTAISIDELIATSAEKPKVELPKLSFGELIHLYNLVVSDDEIPELYKNDYFKNQLYWFVLNLYYSKINEAILNKINSYLTGPTEESDLKPLIIDTNRIKRNEAYKGEFKPEHPTTLISTSSFTGVNRNNMPSKHNSSNEEEEEEEEEDFQCGSFDVPFHLNLSLNPLHPDHYAALDEERLKCLGEYITMGNITIDDLKIIKASVERDGIDFIGYLKAIGLTNVSEPMSNDSEFNIDSSFDLNDTKDQTEYLKYIQTGEFSDVVPRKRSLPKPPTDSFLQCSIGKVTEIEPREIYSLFNYIKRLNPPLPENGTINNLNKCLKGTKKARDTEGVILNSRKKRQLPSRKLRLLPRRPPSAPPAPAQVSTPRRRKELPKLPGITFVSGGSRSKRRKRKIAKSATKAKRGGGSRSTRKNQRRTRKTRNSYKKSKTRRVKK